MVTAKNKKSPQLTEWRKYLLARLAYICALVVNHNEYEPDDVEKLEQVMVNATQVFQKQNCAVKIKKIKKGGIVIFGDIHGSLEGLIKMWQKAMIRMRQYNTAKVIFMGDYVDRGAESLACLEFICLLVSLFPNQVIALRGNHELRHVNGKENEENSFKNNCIQKCATEEDGLKIWDLANDMFEYMSLVCIVGENKGSKILCLHGFIDPDVKIEDIEKLQKPLRIQGKDSLPSRLLWSDPSRAINVTNIHEGPVSEFNTIRKCGRLVNQPAAIKWMDDNGFGMIYRGHQFAPLGIDHCANKRVITVFSAFRYNDTNNVAAFVHIRRDYSRHITYFKDDELRYDKIRADDLESTYSFEEGETMAKDAAAHKNKTVKPAPSAEDKKKAAEKPPIDNVSKKSSFSGGSTGSASSGSGSGGAPFGSMITLCLTILCFLSGIASAAPSSSSSSLSQFATNSSTLARFVNGISLSQSISKGNLDKKQLIDELFFLGSDMTLDSLAASKVSQLVDELVSVQGVIGTECPGDDGCGLPKSILDGMSTVDGLKAYVNDVVKARDAFQVGSLDSLNKVSNAVFSVSSSKISSLVEKLKKLQSATTTVMQKEFKDIFDELSKLALVSNDLKEKPTFVADFEKTSKTLKTDLLPIKPIVEISKKLSGQNSAIIKFKKDLVSSGPKYQKLAKGIRKETLQDIDSRIEFLMNAISSLRKDRILTAGLLNGYDDIQKITSFDSDPWLKNFLTSDGNLTMFSSKLAHLKSLQTLLHPLSVQFDLFTRSSDISPQLLKWTLSNTAEAVSKLSRVIPSYRGFISGLSLQHTFTEDVDRFLASLELPSEAVKVLAVLGPFLSNNKPRLDVIAKTSDSLTIYLASSQFSKLGAYLQSNTVLKDTIDALDAMNVEINNKQLYMENLSVRLGAIQKLIDTFNKWVDETGFLKTMNLLEKNDVHGIIKSSNSTVNNLAMLKPGNKDVESIIGFAKSLENLSTEWIKLKPTILSRSKRAAKLELEDAQKVSKDLGDISSITLKLDGLLKMETDLNTLIGGKQAIESAIGEVKDQKEQDRLKKMWTPENLAALQKNLATAKAVSDVVSKNKIAGNMTDFKAPFEKASEVQECWIDIKRLASSLKGMIKDQTVAASLESSKNLDLQFVKYDQTRVGGVITGLQTYFNSVFGVKSSEFCDPAISSCSSDEDPPKCGGYEWWEYRFYCSWMDPSHFLKLNGPKRGVRKLNGPKRRVEKLDGPNKGAK